MRMGQAMRRFTAGARHREQMLSAGLYALDLSRFIDHKRDILARCRQELISGMKTRLNAQRSRFGIAVGKIDALSPLSILSRGFALCRDDRGAIVKNAADVSCGDIVSVTLAKGCLDCEVKQIANEELRFNRQS